MVRKSRYIIAKKRKRKIRFIRFIVSAGLMVFLLFMITPSIKGYTQKWGTDEEHPVMSSTEKPSSDTEKPSSDLEKQNDVQKVVSTENENSISENEGKDSLQAPILKEEEPSSTTPVQATVDLTDRKNYKQVFAQDMFVGDSITEGISFYGLLNKSNVLAHLGNELRKSQNEVYAIVKNHPKNIFLLFGPNDLETGMTKNLYIQRYQTLIHKIQERLPDVQIYVQAILPIEAKVEKVKRHITTARIEEFNKGLEEMSQEENIHYVDMASVVKTMEPNLHGGDGIHFKRQFYYFWLNYLTDQIKNV